MPTSWQQCNIADLPGGKHLDSLAVVAIAFQCYLSSVTKHCSTVAVRAISTHILGVTLSTLPDLKHMFCTAVLPSSWAATVLCMA